MIMKPVSKYSILLFFKPLFSDGVCCFSGSSILFPGCFFAALRLFLRSSAVVSSVLSGIPAGHLSVCLSAGPSGQVFPSFHRFFTQARQIRPMMICSEEEQGVASPMWKRETGTRRLMI